MDEPRVARPPKLTPDALMAKEAVLTLLLAAQDNVITPDDVAARFQSDVSLRLQVEAVPAIIKWLEDFAEACHRRAEQEGPPE